MAQKKSIYRRITELSPKGILKEHVIKRYVALKVKNYLLIILFIQASLLLIVLVFLTLLLKDRQGLRELREEKYAYWSGVAGQYPNKPDILFNAGKSAYEIGEKGTAIQYLEKALQIDPLFKNAEIVLEEIKK